MPETVIKDGFDETEHKFPGTKEKLKRYGSPFFLIAPRRQGRFATRNVNDVATEIPYWWHKSVFTQKILSHGVSNVNLFDFMLLLVDYGKVLWSFANEL